MNNEKTSTFSHVLLWFGAAISIAEIMTGALIAPLGFSSGLYAIIIGHAIGGAILLPAGLIGAKSNLSSAESIRLSFGKYGSYCFSLINILQLLGWSAIMIITGAKSLNGITLNLWNYGNEKLWCALIGILICFWTLLGIKNLTKLNSIVVSLLFLFTILLGFALFSKTGTVKNTEYNMTFGSAVELNVAMSLSWLPLMSDYTRQLKKKISGTILSILSYLLGSILMFIIGLGASIYAGSSDIVELLLCANLGLISLIIVLLSTVTTTFLDVYSAGINAINLNSNINEKIFSVILCIIGTLFAMFIPIEEYENFLYLIGSVFAPLFAILFVDYFILYNEKSKNTTPNFNKNIILWVIGFIIYRFALPYNSILGITLPIMIIIGIISFVINKINLSRLFRF